MSPEPNLNPWNWRDVPTPVSRLRSLTPASGWFGVDGWVTDTGDVDLLWEPVIAWAIQRGERPDEDDEVLAVLRLEGGPQVGVHEQPMALHTEAERTDEAVLAGCAIRCGRGTREPKPRARSGTRRAASSISS